MKYLLDTSVVVAYTREKAIAGDFINNAKRGTQFYLSTITIGELFLGVYCSNNPSKGIYEVQMFMQAEGITLVDFDVSMAEEFGEMVAYLRSNGDAIPRSDVMLAATANILGVPIVTLDKRHFEKLKEMGVQVKVLE